MRKEKIITREHYHVFNRGVDKREIFMEEDDLCRFYQSMMEFNVIDPIGSIYEKIFYADKPPKTKTKKLVNFISYCLNPNHFHFILEQLVDNGISRFMHRLSCGYTNYFNEKYNRSGALFQGRFKAKHVDSNEYLLYLSAYVNLNNEVHQLGRPDSKNKIKSSWKEYATHKKSFCEKGIILNQFNQIKDYNSFAKDALELMVEKKRSDKEIQNLLFE